jgi:Holliday junction resolvase-like predicted endonuclease
MKNYNCVITWNSHCNEEDIISMKKQILECVRVKFWNVKNLELTYKKVGEDNDIRKKT